MTEPLIIAPQKKSWISYTEHSDFPIQNIPLGVFSNDNAVRRMCSIIGDQVIDLAGLAQDGFLDPTYFQASDFISENLNPLLQRGRAVTRALRQNIAELFDESNHQVDRTKCKTHLYARSLVTLHLPVKPGNYTDFYSSREHATN
ncbi:MAG TPA: fumarylacetoacetase, partial [Saprospiraceae bacterium]|nr:fumarylacetoacetase [Saprospiraceae bacterium]